MFENASVEYADLKCGKDNRKTTGWVLTQEDFQKGAEFGYNKANKWHILAEEPDVLPTEGQKVKVLTEEGDIEDSTYFYDTYFEEFAWSNIGLIKVLAWKEIVLPEPKENGE